MFSKKALGPVVGVALLLVVGVTAVIGFQTWFQGYSSQLFTQSESQGSDLTTGVERVVGENLFLNSGKNLTVSSVRIDGNDCNINGTFSGMTRFNVSECLSQTSNPTPDVVVVTKEGIISETIYRDNLATSQQTLLTNPRADPQCYSAAVNTIGSWEGCNNTLIIDRSMLTSAVTNNNTINGGSDYYIEFGGTNYTFGDSQFNIFTGQVTNMSGLFEGSWSEKNPFNSSINYWDVSNVEDMSQMYMHSNFNQPITSWNTSSVVDMNLMFGFSVYNQPLNLWDVSNVTNMALLFESSLFNHDISMWDTSSVQNMSRMFEYSYFNQDISSWNTSNVVDMSNIFYDTRINFSLNSWDVSNVKNMQQMFSGSANNYNHPLDNWDTSNVVNMVELFSFNDEFNQDISSWNTSNVETMRGMFSYTDTFNQSLNSWDVSKVQDMVQMFYTSVYDKPLNNWSTGNVLDMTNMFWSSDFNQNISSWNTSSVTQMDRMFRSATSFNQDLSSWDVDQVTSCSDFDLNANNWILPKPNLGAC